jgi:hypothetical protein
LLLTCPVLDRLPNDSETKTFGRIAKRVAVHGTTVGGWGENGDAGIPRSKLSKQR